MSTTHCKHCSLIPLLVSNNNLALLRCRYICAGMLVHISRHLGRTSNNKRCQLIISCMLCRVCFHRDLHLISGLWSLLYYSCLHPTLLRVFYSTSLLLLSYYTMRILCLISLAMSLLALVCLCSWHDFQCMFMFRIYRYTCAIYARHLAFASPLVREFWLPKILMSRSQSLELVGSLSSWSVWRGGSVDHRQTVWSPTLPGPLLVSRVFLL